MTMDESLVQLIIKKYFGYESDLNKRLQEIH